MVGSVVRKDIARLKARQTVHKIESHESIENFGEKSGVVRDLVKVCMYFLYIPLSFVNYVGSFMPSSRWHWVIRDRDSDK
jgi:hypothetical protein